MAYASAGGVALSRTVLLHVVVLALFALGSYFGIQRVTEEFFGSDTKLEELKEEDIFFAWLEGDRILDGKNPYARVLDGDMRRNDKYATYFPGFYLASAGLQAIGRESFEEQVELGLVLLPFFHAAMGMAILWAFAARHQLILGIAAALLFLFGRFNLYNIEILHLENFVLLPYVLAFLLLPRWPRAAFVLFGVSLALKQIGIFLVPLFVLHAWWLAREAPGFARRALRTTTACLWFVVPPLLVSLPFLLWNPEAYLKSVLFSATRQSDSHLGMYSLDSVMNWEGTVARLPMLGIMALMFFAAAARRLPLALMAALVMGAFVSFNPVLYRQYFVWALVPLLFAVAEMLEETEQGRTGQVAA